jgi:hypothetical protein
MSRLPPFLLAERLPPPRSFPEFCPDSIPPLWPAPSLTHSSSSQLAPIENNTLRYFWHLVLTNTFDVLSGFHATRRTSKHIAPTILPRLSTIDF